MENNTSQHTEKSKDIFQGGDACPWCGKHYALECKCEYNI